MRNISFALTTPQFYRRHKTVTRRMGWEDIEPGQILCGIVKGQGLRLGESIQRLAIIRVSEPTREKLSAITAEEVAREGFPGMDPRAFIRMFCDSHESCRPASVITRIPFQFIPGGRFVCRGFCRACGCSSQDACESDAFGDTCRWVDERGLLSSVPTTLCSRCAFVDRFHG